MTDTPNVNPDAAEALKARLRADLKLAMRARATAEISVLRSLITALDNAQAVPVGDGPVRYVERAFGDPSGEIPRLTLDAVQVEALLEREECSRRDAASQFQELGQTVKADEFRGQALIVARYHSDR